MIGADRFLRYGFWFVFILFLLAAALVLSGCSNSDTSSSTDRFFLVFQSQGKQLKLHILDDDLVHLEWSGPERVTDPETPIPMTPSVYKRDYPGPDFFAKDSNGKIETKDLLIRVEPTTLALTVYEKLAPGDALLTVIAPIEENGLTRGMAMDSTGFTHVYGLGEQFLIPGEANGDWAGLQRTPGNSYGNAMVAFNGGSTNGGFNGNAQFPVMYALGDEKNYALYVDLPRALTWDFVAGSWHVVSTGTAMRSFLMSGSNLPDLRHDYMELTGRPPVPPKKMFGLWVSQYGYRDWTEVEDNLISLREAGFPVDGFVLDLFWFGGIEDSSPDSHMGSLTWDLSSFTDPSGAIAQLGEQGVGILVVEESYVSSGLEEYEVLEKRGALVRQTQGGQPVSMGSWWGQGGMLDWTNDVGADFWFDYRRLPLISDGVLGHWTDLGEPEDYDPEAWYHGLPGLEGNAHADVCNYYNFKWLESISRGYERHDIDRRPFMLSRSGTAGIQRFGAAMWSGDIAARLSSLRTHFNAQMHMSFSGMDYYGADIGGFWRKSLGGDLNELYTRWFANGMAFDVLGRPHTFNLDKNHQDSPEKIGDIDSNLANVRLRYQLSPYVYSVAHQAHLYGDPVFPPLVYYFQDDSETRTLGNHKMIGPCLLARACAGYGESEADVYLPSGTWVAYHTGEWVDSQGEWIRNVPLFVEGRYTLPLYARAGALIPEMHMDEDTLNIAGLRTDGNIDKDLAVRVFASDQATQFVLYEDDGWSRAYLNGRVRTTRIEQALDRDIARVTIFPGVGAYQGALDKRNNWVVLITRGRTVIEVSVNGVSLPRHDTLEQFNAAYVGWYMDDPSLVRAKSGFLPVNQTKEFLFRLSSS